MNQRNLICAKHLWLGLLVITAGVITGCAKNPAEHLRQRLAQLGDTRLDHAIRQSMVATGGIETWAHLQRIDGQAVAALADTQGGKTLIQQQHVIVPGERVMISVSSKETNGVLLEWLDNKGRVQTIFQGEPGQVSLNPEMIDLYAAALRLRLLSQAMTGAMGLLQKDFILRYAGQERQGGRQTYKIEVTGPILGQDQFDYGRTGNLLTVWIDAETFLFEKLWLRYHKDNSEFGYLALNIADYAQTSEGLVLPRHIEFVHSDEYQQFGHQYIMTLEYQKLQVTQLEK
ncbi:hypothetical protein ACFL02_02160 [Planctomycetota bacterium]